MHIRKQKCLLLFIKLRITGSHVSDVPRTTP